VLLSATCASRLASGGRGHCAQPMVTETDLRLRDGRTLHAYDAAADGGATRLAVFWHHGTPNLAPPEPLFPPRTPSHVAGCWQSGSWAWSAHQDWLRSTPRGSTGSPAWRQPALRSCAPPLGDARCSRLTSPPRTTTRSSSPRQTMSRSPGRGPGWSPSPSKHSKATLAGWWMTTWHTSPLGVRPRAGTPACPVAARWPGSDRFQFARRVAREPDRLRGTVGAPRRRHISVLGSAAAAMGWLRDRADQG
jgi:hypothetical protein